MCLLVCSKEG